MFDEGGEDGPDPPIGGGVILGDGAGDDQGHHFGHAIAVGGVHPHAHSEGQGQGGVNVNGLMGAMGAAAIDEDEEFGEGSEIMAGD